MLIITNGLILDQETIVTVSKNESHNLVGTKLVTLLKEIFLPQGYPFSVSKDYIHYQIWDTVQAFCSSINGKFILKISFTFLSIVIITKNCIYL